MEKFFNILMLTPNFNLLCGRSKSVYNLTISLKNKGCKVIIATNGGDNINKLSQNNIDVLLLRWFSDGIKPIIFLRSLIELKKILSNNSFDIIHSHHRFYELVINLINFFFYKKSLRTVFTANNIYLKRRPFQFMSYRIIAVSNFVRENLINKNKVDENKVVVVYNLLLANEIFELTNINRKIKSDNTVILASGRFDLSNNFLILFESLKLLKNEKVILNLIGEGVYKKEYEKIISNNVLNIRILEPTKHFFDYLRNSDICVTTSVNEGMSYFILESIYSNKYIVAPKVGGPIELLEGYDKCILYKPGSYKDLTEKIQKIIKDGLLLKSRNISFSNDKLSEYYSVNLVMQTYENIVNNLKKESFNDSR